MRKIVDALVESRKWKNVDAYAKLITLPYGIMDVVDYKNTIKLEKGSVDDVQPISFNNASVGKNLLRVEQDSECKIIVHGKEFSVSPQIFMIIRGHILSAISCSEKFSKAYCDAITDWFEGNACRITEKQASESLQNCVYFEAYNSLNEVLQLHESSIE